MIVFESRLARRFVGRLERGEEVVATLRQLCEQQGLRAAWVRGTGIVEWAELIEWDPEREGWTSPRRVQGPIEVAALHGSVAIRGGPLYVDLHVALVRNGEASVHAFGGTLAAARTYALDFAIDGYDDVRLERDEDPATGMPLFKGPSARGVLARDGRGRESPAPSRASSHPVPPVPDAAAERDGAADAELPRAADVGVPAAGSVSWAEVAAASRRAEQLAAAAPHGPRAHRTDPTGHGLLGTAAPRHVGAEHARPAPLDAPVPRRGDWVDHRQFGLCRVEGEDDGGLRIRLPSGVRKVIRLDVLEVLPPRREGDRTIFSLRPRKR